MRSAKSFFNGAIARSDLRRYWPVLFLYVGLWLLFLPIPVWNRAAERNPALVNLTELCADTYATAVVLALIFGGIMATAVFSYLMQTRSVGAMHALPQRRGTLFWTHFLTGWAMLAAGNLLHFIYDWTGQSPIAAPLAAVNESTWEHMKLFITPWVLWSLVERIALQGHGSLLPARGLGMLTGLAAIPALFYTYQGILGRGIMWVDVLIFQLAVLLAFWVSWSVQARRVLDGPVWQILGGVTLLAVWGLAIWWTYAPPQLPLFVDPTDGSRGIPLR